MDPVQAQALAMFDYYSLPPQSLLTRPQLTGIFDKQAQRHFKRPFQRTILEQFWEESEPSSKGEVRVSNVSRTINEAVIILEQRITGLQAQDGTDKRKQDKAAMQQELSKLQEQHYQGLQQSYDRINTLRRNLNTLSHTLVREEQDLKRFKAQHEEITLCLQVPAKVAVVEQSHYLVPDSVEESRVTEGPNNDLSLLFKLAVVGACLELLILAVHYSFLSLLIHLLVIFWLFVGYPTPDFVKVLLFLLGLSMVLDFVYVLLVLCGVTGTNRQVHQRAYAIVYTVFLVIELAIKVLMIIKLCPFINPPRHREYFTLFGRDIELNQRSPDRSRTRYDR